MTIRSKPPATAPAIIGTMSSDDDPFTPTSKEAHIGLHCAVSQKTRKLSDLKIRVARTNIHTFRWSEVTQF